MRLLAENRTNSRLGGVHRVDQAMAYFVLEC